MKSVLQKSTITSFGRLKHSFSNFSISRKRSVPITMKHLFRWLFFRPKLKRELKHNIIVEQRLYGCLWLDVTCNKPGDRRNGSLSDRRTDERTTERSLITISFTDVAPFQHFALISMLTTKRQRRRIRRAKCALVSRNANTGDKSCSHGVSMAKHFAVDGGKIWFQWVRKEFGLLCFPDSIRFENEIPGNFRFRPTRNLG